MATAPAPGGGELLELLPLVAYFADDDSRNTIQILSGIDGKAFGYDVADIVGQTHFLNARFLDPADFNVVADHRTAVWAGNSPVISRLHVLDAYGVKRPSLLISHSLHRRKQRIGVAGVIWDISKFEGLQGECGVLSKGIKHIGWNQRVVGRIKYNLDWLADVLPVVLTASENNANYTVHRVFGSFERIVGYSREQVIMNRGIKAWSLIHPDELDTLDESTDELMRRGKHVPYRLRVFHENADTVQILAFVRAWQAPGSKTGYLLSAFFDISDVPALQGPPGVLR